jgi:hypothetical protein
LLCRKLRVLLEWPELARSVTVECNQAADGRFVTPSGRTSMSGFWQVIHPMKFAGGQFLTRGRENSNSRNFLNRFTVL